MRPFTFFLIIFLTIFWSASKSDFINEVRDKYGKPDKSYSVKMKSVTKDSEKNKPIKKKSKKYNSKK
jgi:hypothetical protein